MVLKALARRVLPPWDLDEVGMVFYAIGRTPGTMLDVGAHQGYSAAPFLVRKWTVYAFEPDPANRAILSKRFPNLTIDPRAISERDGDEVQLFTSDVSTGISTLSPFHSTHTPTTTVRTVRLDTYIREHGIEQVDFLKTDTEGFDLFVLRTFPWDTLHPKAVVCEFEDNKTTRLGYDVHDIARFLQQQGYSIVVSEWEPITQYGVRHTWRRFARYPTELGGDTWGNLIAVDPSLLESIERAGQSAVRRMRIRRWAES
ncbi:FkbM family methyltransferase [Mycobacterium sherrisii]|uniref:FkbM family methyltransferase n=1 Tax=Mycobacterium sherrisii TaxID=243061 RepID=UPI000A15FB6D|nr:FkbM family methyltransferase [Mycobacterium sherrisii]MCV7030341.1 FkbM family methyltransferase [Mycobacterium sherrisii]